MGTAENDSAVLGQNEITAGSRPSMKPKVLQLITSLKIGGAETIVRAVVQGLSSHYDFAVAYLKEGGRTEDDLKALGVAPRRLAGFSQLYAFLKEWEPQILHTHLYRAQIMGGVAGALARVPTRIASRWAQDDWRSLPLKWLDRATTPLFHHFVTNSNSTRRRLIDEEHLRPERVSVILHGLPDQFGVPEMPADEARKKFSMRNTGPILGGLSRLHLEKGADRWLDIASGVLKRFPKATFYLAGDGPYRSTLERGIRQRGLQDTILLVGWVRDTAAFLSALDVLVLPSREESLAQALVEAAAVGTPFVAFDVGGNSEVVEWGATGTLVPSGDLGRMVHSISEAIEGHDALIRKAHLAIPAIKKRASLQQMLASLNGLYLQFLDGKECGSGPNSL